MVMIVLLMAGLAALSVFDTVVKAVRMQHASFLVVLLALPIGIFFVSFALCTVVGSLFGIIAASSQAMEQVRAPERSTPTPRYNIPL
jgi:uncharacterized membrane protein